MIDDRSFFLLLLFMCVHFDVIRLFVYQRDLESMLINAK
jgi:hypothetical protein